MNALEQLCINWTDEKLEQFYVQTVFQNMLDECK